MAVTIGSLIIRLGLNMGELQSGLTKAEQQFRRTVRSMERSGREMQDRGQRLTVGITAPLAALGATAIRGFMEQSRAIADVEAALRSMGGASGRTSAQLAATADALEMRSLFDADVILKQVTANLLTFGNIAGSVFDRAQQAALDMATRMGGEPQAAAMQLGRALNDPVNALAALGRNGTIQRDWIEANKQRIRGMVEEGRIAEAQGLVLEQVERQMRGSAAAAAAATPWRQAQVAINQAMDTIGEAAVPILRNVAEAVAGVARAFSALPDGAQQTVVAILAISAAVGPLTYALGGLRVVTAGARAAMKVFTPAVVEASVAAGTATPALVGLRAATASLLASIAPYALVLGAAAAAIYIITVRSREGTVASAQYAAQQERLRQVQAQTAVATSTLASATGQAREEALANARALREETSQYLANARAALETARAKARQRLLEARQVRFSPGNAMSGGSTMSVGGNFAAQRTEVIARQARTDAAAARETVVGLETELNRLNSIINAPVPIVASVAASGGGGPSAADIGRSEAEIARRFEDELGQYLSQIAAARQSQALSASEAAELEGRQLEHSRLAAHRALQADEDYSEAQRNQLALMIDALADEERDAIAFRQQQELERERADMMQVAFDREREGLALQGELADTEAERRDVAMAILALEQEYRRNQLEMVLASATATEAEKARAQAILGSLAAIEAGERASNDRRSETQAQSYMRSLKQTPAQINEALDGIAINGLESLNRGLVDAMVNFKSLGDVAKNVIQQILSDLLTLQIRQAIIGPLASALNIGGAGGKSGGGGLLSGLLKAGMAAYGGGKAIGGPVSANKMYLVGERGPELFAPGRNGAVIPNGALRQRGGGDTYAPVFHFSGVTDPRQAREAGSQAALAFRRRLNGPVGGR